MKLEIRNPAAADVEGLGKMWNRSFNEDVLNLNLFPRIAPTPADASSTAINDIYASDGYVELRNPIALAWRQERLLEILAENDEGRRLRVIVDNDVRDTKGRERIIGYAGWITPKVQQEAGAKAKDEKESQAVQEKRVEGLDMALLSHYKKTVAEEKLKHVGTKGEHWELALLCVDPAYYRKGIGKMLLRDGLAIAAEQGKVIYSEATPAGLPLYISEGFEELGEIILDNLTVGGSYRIVPIIKRPAVASS